MRAFFALVLLLSSIVLRAEVDDSLRVDSPPTINPVKLGVVGGATVLGFIGGHALSNELWWKGEKAPFHVNTSVDYTYALNADKLGHMTFSYMASSIYSDLFRRCGMDSTQSAWSGFGVTMAYQTFVEIRDGFSADYGFSWGDIAANTIGAALPVAQRYVPALRSMDLQISFWPSQAFNNGAYNSIIDDYTSTTHWLTVNVSDVSPRSWQSWIPPWLGLAIGHSVQNTDGQGGGQHVVYLSLDWQLHRIPGLAPWLRDVLRVLHLYHLPAPAVRILPNVVWYGLRF
ncbi:MAG: DUF2279 domain-containing protein [Candidatus Kapabacteria bacterium]|nr:DUF2279 domain-containing protein [Candidatus Kapabacteria bacterium]